MNEFEYRVVWLQANGFDRVLVQTANFDDATAFVRQFESSLFAGEVLAVQRYPVIRWETVLTREGGSL